MMNTLQLQPRTAPAAEEAFTTRELDAAEQLVHLSASSSSSGAPRIAGRAAPTTSRLWSSSPRSVNAPPAPAPAAETVLLGGCRDWEEGEVAGSQRRVKRFRLIAEIYAATKDFGGRGGRQQQPEVGIDEVMDREGKEPLVINVVPKG